MSKYYKIVRVKRDGRRMSFILEDIHQVGIEYKEDEFVEASPKMSEWGYHPAVFESLQALGEFAGLRPVEILEDYLRAYIERRSHNAEVWECECEEEVSLPIFLDWAASNSWMECGDSNSLFRAYSVPGDRWPPGTKMFKRVKLTKKLF